LPEEWKKNKYRCGDLYAGRKEREERKRETKTEIKTLTNRGMEGVKNDE
jgi:hypothetical protein